MWKEKRGHFSVWLLCRTVRETSLTASSEAVKRHGAVLLWEAVSRGWIKT